MMILCIIFYSFLSYYSDSDKLFELIIEFPIEIIKAFIYYYSLYIAIYQVAIHFQLLRSKSINNKDLLIWFGSLAFAATPLRTGELSRCFLLKQKCSIDKSFSLAAILFERELLMAFLYF